MERHDIDNLQKRLGHEFAEQGLLEIALTHRSLSRRNNERLEFLGDSIVNFVIAEALYHRFPDANEGNLSRLRARLVKGMTLAEIGSEFDLGQCLRLGTGELKSGGFRRESILADAVEAIIGAIYLDAGMTVCRQRINDWFSARLNKLTLADAHNKDPKSRLQEYLQARQQTLPKYQVTNIQGEAHDQYFSVTCKLECLDEMSKGNGSSRRDAEQQAALNALILLGVE